MQSPKMSVKTSSSLEKSKIKIHIESLTKNIQKLLVDVGEKVYSLWLQGGTAIQSLAKKLETVKHKKKKLNSLL